MIHSAQFSCNLILDWTFGKPNFMHDIALTEDVNKELLLTITRRWQNLLDDF